MEPENTLHIFPCSRKQQPRWTRKRRIAITRRAAACTATTAATEAANSTCSVTERHAAWIVTAAATQAAH
eukprot:CAMPEP_0202750286 /NCGR_PEP_ID=MMETSP1388-20130828/11207_1 /ASSEMBLY_ACC=CAM_ASM_000864 /TAXON_ID=37098 /ORGANISM="Isochrysis sp, Strain CCMP1244" /LENGTH=69 /DNA_ID=CAMNT_0049417859 /DNA_START=51 /DNA_END=257 /DNA_ORIENTATION=-